MLLQLSELSVRTHALPFSCEDLPLGPCSCGQQLEQYQQEVADVRQELLARVGELEGLQRELAAAREEQAGTLEELSQSRQQLQASRHETAQLDHEVREEVAVELHAASYAGPHFSVVAYLCHDNGP